MNPGTRGKILLGALLLCMLQAERAQACNPVTGLFTSSITHTSAVLNWFPVVCDSFLVRYYVAGTTDVHFKSISNGGSVSLAIDTLYPNTTYSWLIHTYCNGGQAGPYQLSPATFSTANGYVSCLPPNQLLSRNITNTTANVAWNHLVSADTFLVRYHVSGTVNYTWTYIQGIYHSVTLTGLTPSSIYEWNVRAICNGGILPTNYTDTFVTNCDTLPAPAHIVICIMENKGFQQIIDSVAIAPYINALVTDPLSALFTQSYAITHPSQPNYLEFFSGSNQGMTNNNVPASHFTTPNLARALLDAGKSFVTYSENLPYTGCDTVRNGDYERKHNPVANWMGTGVNQVPDSCNQPFTNFPVDYNLLPTVSYVVPDQANDMHNGTITQGDTWIETHLNDYVQWAKSNNSLFIVTFDEDNGAYNNRIITIFCGPMVSGGRYAKYMNHYSLLRTIEDMYQLSHAGKSESVESVRECWISGYTGIESFESPAPEWAVYGYAGTGELNVDYTLQYSSAVSIQVFSDDGKLVHEQTMARKQPGTYREIIHPLNHAFTSGFYIVRLGINDRVFSKKTVLVY
jgi:phosphatidylinositol-3-phosphatase